MAKKQRSSSTFKPLFAFLILFAAIPILISCNPSEEDNSPITTGITSSLTSTAGQSTNKDPNNSNKNESTTSVQTGTSVQTSTAQTCSSSDITTTTMSQTTTQTTKEPLVPVTPEIDVTEYKTWVVDCNEYIGLRTAPDFSAKSILSIPKGERVTLLEFCERFAYVQYDKKNSKGEITRSYKGYVVAAYIVLPEESSYTLDLDTVKPVEKYTYDQMLTDLAVMSEKHPSRLTLSSIGKSEEGRDLVLAVMGNPSAENHIFVQASIHAREHMTTTLVMAQMDYMLTHEDHLYKDTGVTISEILDTTCFHIVPMANPDGVNIVQTGILPDEFKGKYSSYEISQWKANAKGVDLNANFDGDWENHGNGSVTAPGPYDYKGSAPECAAESKALADYIRANDFDITLSYHVTGSVIYYNYGDNDKINDLNLDLAQRIDAVAGYEPRFQSEASSAGLKDWAIEKLGIVSLTIEFGSFNPPLMEREFSNLWARGRDTLIISALWQTEHPER